MATIAFTKNYTDHSNAQGYQFEFHCDKCGNGYRSSYVANKAGMATSFLGAAADLFGGVLNQAARAGEHLKDALRGKAWDDAFAAAIMEIRPRFKQCGRCGIWVCPEVCWNGGKGLCENCAPDLQEEAASAQAGAAKQQVMEKALATDQLGGMDLKQSQVASCPHCGAKAAGGKFCPDCGKPLSDKTVCGKCKASFPAAAKFCPECGAPRT